MIKRSYKSNNPFNDHDHCEFCMAKFGKGNDELKQGSLRLDSDIYYEIVPLIEGAFAKRDFIILSNSTFESFRKHKASVIYQMRINFCCRESIFSDNLTLNWQVSLAVSPAVSG